MPVWFIEVFGLLFLIGTLWVGVEHGIVWGTSTAVSVALAMLLIRGAVKRRTSTSGIAPASNPANTSY